MQLWYVKNTSSIREMGDREHWSNCSCSLVISPLDPYLCLSAQQTSGEVVGGRDLVGGEVGGVDLDVLPDAGVGPDGEADPGREHHGLVRGGDDVAEEALGEPVLADPAVVGRPVQLLQQLRLLHEPAAAGDVPLEAALHVVPALPQRLRHHVGDAVRPPHLSDCLSVNLSSPTCCRDC